jgi:hypothetical protein
MEPTAWVIVIEWEQFRLLELNRIRQRMAFPVLIDLRNIYSGEKMEGPGLHVGIGRSVLRRAVRLLSGPGDSPGSEFVQILSPGAQPFAVRSPPIGSIIPRKKQ